MFELTRYELRRRRRGIAVLAGLLSAYALLNLAFFPSVAASGGAIEEYVQSLPPALRRSLGIVTLTSVDGYLASQLYQFGWTLLLGMYVAYRGGSLVAAEVEAGRADLWLAAPLSRRRYVLERFAAVVPTVIVVNAVTAVVVALGVVAVGEPVPAADLLVVHAVAVPYLLVCAAGGLVMSTLTARADLAQQAALGLVFGLFLLETLAETADVGVLGAVTPMRYFDPAGILVEGAYDLLGAAVLLAGAATLILLATATFRRADLP